LTSALEVGEWSLSHPIHFTTRERTFISVLGDDKCEYSPEQHKATMHHLLETSETE
jgi:hypothetical protein